MNWLNISMSTMDTVAFRMAESAAVGVWLRLMRYCCGQENGGRIDGARQWTPRQWTVVVGLTADEVTAPSNLWHWEEADLVVEFYPREKEKEVREKRAGGRRGGKASGRSRNQALEDDASSSSSADASSSASADASSSSSADASSSASADASSSASADASSSASTEEKRREENGIPHTPKGGGDELVGKFCELPAPEEVFAFAAKWPGEMASCTPAIDPEFVKEFLREKDGRVHWPRDWRRSLISDWRAKWRGFQSRPAAPAHNPASPTAERIGREKKLAALEQAWVEHAGNPASTYYVGADFLTPEVRAAAQANRTEAGRLRDLLAKENE